MWFRLTKVCVALFLTVTLHLKAAPATRLAGRHWKSRPLFVWAVAFRSAPTPVVCSATPPGGEMKKPHNTCGKCGNEYVLGNDTATLHLFELAPGYSYLAATCPIPACENDELVFFIPGGYKLSEMVAFEFDTVVKGQPDDWVVTVYNKVTDSSPVKVYDELTSNQEKVLRYAAFDLEDFTVDDIVSAPKGKHPVRWD